jgi:hypothetical protein
VSLEEDMNLIGATLDSYVRVVNRYASGVNGPFQLDDAKAAFSRTEANVKGLRGTMRLIAGWQAPPDSPEARKAFMVMVEGARQALKGDGK